MMQSEFYERTKVNVTGEEYHDIETAYNNVQMDKDEFCKLWLENRDNKLVSELMDAVNKLDKERTVLNQNIDDQQKEVESIKAQSDGELMKMSESHTKAMQDLAARIIKAGDYDMDSAIYDILEEEFGLPFIIKTKYVNAIDLQDKEIDYMVKQL